MKWRYFGRRKHEVSEIGCNFIRKLIGMSEDNGNFPRMENSRESNELELKLEKERIDVQVDFTASNTPEHNGKVERIFETLLRRVKDMLNNSGVLLESRESIWVGCAMTATKLYNIIHKKRGIFI